MKTTIYYLQILLISSALIMWSSASLSDERNSIPERNALRYMTAFFAIEMDEVIALTHPDVIDEFHQAYLAEISLAEDEGRSETFLSDSGISLSIKELKEMTKKELFLFVTSSNNRRASKAALEHMKSTKFLVLGSDAINEHITIVTMSMGNPQPNREFGLELKLHDKKWLVVGNAP